MIELDIANSFRGTALCKLYRVLDLMVFTFADAEAGKTTSLHVLCPSDLAMPQGSLFSGTMLMEPAAPQNRSAPLPDAFDLSLEPLTAQYGTQADAAIAQINALLPKAVIHTSAFPDGRIAVSMEQGIVLRIMPNGDAAEQWRIVQGAAFGNCSRHLIFENGCFSVETLRHLGPS